MGTSYYDYGSGYYGTGYEQSSDMLGAILAFYGVTIVISLIASIFVLICLWIIFKKAGKKGWEAIIPVYNFITLLEITNLPIWYIALFLVPFANIYALFKVYIELAHKFGKSTGFGIGLIFLGIIFMPILAFGKATYEGGINNFYSNQNVNQMPNNQFVQNSNMNQNYNQIHNQDFANSVQAKFCPNCGHELNANAKFCANCGFNCNN